VLECPRCKSRIAGSFLPTEPKRPFWKFWDHWRCRPHLRISISQKLALLNMK
jgi:hypothetical protein